MVRILSAFTAAALIAMAAPVHAAESSSFSGSGSSQFFGFEIDHAAKLSGSIVSSFTGLAGYDITSVSINGMAIPDLLPNVGADYFEFSLDLAPGVHTIAIKGLSFGGSYVGAYSLSPVPEVDASALTVAGLAAVGLVAARRRRTR